MNKFRYILDLQFFGRGRSSASGSGGGGATTATPVTPTIQATAAPTSMAPPPDPDVTATVDDTTQAQPMGTSYDAFMAMTDDEKADVLNQAYQNGVPAHLNQNSGLQSLIYNMNLNDKPQVVDDATLDSMNGTEIFRTVNRVYDSSTDIGFTAPQIAKQTMQGKYTRVSDGSTAVYGDGIYFANSRGSSVVYGDVSGNVNRTCVMRAKLNSNAKIVTDYKASQMARQEIRSGSKLGKAIGKANPTAQSSLWALCNGYNVIDAGNGYYNVLNRNAITMSKTVTAK